MVAQGSHLLNSLYSCESYVLLCLWFWSLRSRRKLVGRGKDESINSAVHERKSIILGRRLENEDYTVE